MSASANIARHLPLMAARQPDHPAVKIPRGRSAGRIDYLTLSFRELEAEVAAWGARLSARGVRRGDRVLVMVRPGLPLIAAAFALFQLGAVPVIIDPGMGRKSFLACVARSRPRVLLGLPLAQLISHVFRSAFSSVALRIWVSGAATARLPVAQPSTLSPQPVAESAATDLAAVLFTSGSTGAPKGVCYEHGMFDAQVRLIRDTYGIQPGEVDLPMLPIFALFNPALGMTTVVPEIDPARPATVDPDKIIQAILQENVTNSFGSPTLWRKIAGRCRERNLTLPSLRRVLMAGAPVPSALFADLQEFLPHGTVHSPYGATEALPLCTISAPEVRAETAALTAAGRGACLGRSVPEICVKVIALTDDPLATLADACELPAGEIGEIIVGGPVVTKEYDQLPEATAAAKIAAAPPSAPNPRPGDAAGSWHRMGDLGYLDAGGRLWFCGRKAERVETSAGTLYTELVEPVFNAHPGVRRTALIGLGSPGRQHPALVIEPISAATVATPSDRRRLVRELRQLGEQHPATAAIRRFYLHPGFPVDVRHNAKIHRLALARWTNGKSGYEMDRREISRESLGQ
ncbi:MAG: fatty acid CoA ligase family protein [Opitutales bacterium]